MDNKKNILLFWASVMRDHGEFIINNLSPREEMLESIAKSFKESYIRVINQLETIDVNDSYINNLMELNNNFIDFKKELLRRSLTCEIEFSLPPTFINHMINEAMNFLFDLNKLMNNQVINPLYELIELHKLWLPDAAGHAATIASTLDPTEELMINEAKEFKNIFNSLFIKANELGMMLDRANLTNGTLRQFNMEIKKYIFSFIDFLKRMYDLKDKCQIMTTIKPLYFDHMIREENYYIANIDYLEQK